MSTPPTIEAGAKGHDVELAQYELSRGLYLSGPDDVDGVFGPNTTQAVRAYQQDHGLPVDGIIGPQTWTAMLNEHPDPPILSEGSSGPVVARLQEFLNNPGGTGGSPLTVDGAFGPLTKSAVEHYQAENHVAADGIVGYQTWVIHIGAMNRMVATQVGV
jgi:peptidoglycan hydrolase-like protein with peptidoglycan-binding domain